MTISVVYYPLYDVCKAFGDDRADWQAPEVLAAEERGEFRRVGVRQTDEGDLRVFGAGRNWWEPIEAGVLVGFVDEDSATFTDVADRLWAPIIDEASDEGCAIYVQQRTGLVRYATAKQAPSGFLEVKLTSGDFGDTARAIERLLSVNGFSPLSVPWGRENALTFAGGVKVWAE